MRPRGESVVPNVSLFVTGEVWGFEGFPAPCQGKTTYSSRAIRYSVGRTECNVPGGVVS